MIIRKADLKDLPGLAVLFDDYRQFYEQASDPGLAAAFIEARMKSGTSTILLAEDNRQLVGFCQLYPSFCSVLAAPVYILYDLFVAAPARRGGVARALLEAAARQAVTGKKVRIDLSTAKTNHAAQALYEALGWRRDDVFLTYTLSLQAR